MQTCRFTLLMVVSCCATLVAFALVYVSFTLTREMIIINPNCATPAGPLLQTVEVIHFSWLACGAAVLLSLSCVFTAKRIASASTRWARRITSALLVLSSLALVGLACSFGFYLLGSFCAG